MLQNELNNFSTLQAHINIADHRTKSQALVLQIKRLRKQQGISQAAMAEKLGIAQNAFSKIELGKSDLTVARLYKIAEILKFDLLEVLRSI